MFTSEKKHALSRDLNFYIRVMMVYSVILVSVMLLILSIYVKNYNNMEERISSLDSLYGSFSQMTDDMQQYGITGDELYLEDYSHCREIVEQSLDVLTNVYIDGNYARHLYDLQIMYGKFQEKQQELTQIYQQDNRNGERQQYYSDVYAELLRIREGMDRKEELFRLAISENSAQNKSRVETAMSRLLAVILLAVLDFFLLFWRIADRKVKEILQPIEALTGEAERIREEPLDNFVMQRQDLQGCQVLEINTLSETFQTMLEQIQNQILELQESARVRDQLQQQEIENLQVKKQLEEQKVENLRVKNLLTVTELCGLQMHMNPHFLFNTLNLIRQNAYLGKNEKTVYLLDETAALLRYNLSYNGKQVTLQQELEGLDHYINLQEERFEERVAFEFQLDERFHQVRVPCFILQPFVENSILHGMREINGSLNIRIITKYLEEEQAGLIIIEDNGQGMDAGRLAEVREEMKQDDWENKKSIGMSNVYRRLMIFTGDRAEVLVDSEKGKGTRIQIKIPVTSEEPEEPAGGSYESIDCG